MADFDANDIIRISARMKWDDAYDIVNVYHVILDAGAPLAFSAIQTAVQNYVDTIYGYLTAYLCTNQTDSSIGVSNETQGTVFGSMSWGTWSAGGHAGDSVPLGCSVLTFGRTSRPRVQIRKYFGVFAEVYTTEGAWLSTVRGACENAMTYHISQQTPDTGITWTGVAYRPSTGLVTYATSVSSSEEVAYQRRRKRGRGS